MGWLSVQVAKLRREIRRVRYQLQLLLHDLQILERLRSLPVTPARWLYDHV